MGNPATGDTECKHFEKWTFIQAEALIDTGRPHPALPIQGGGLPITIRQLMKTHGVSERTITPNRKHIKKLARGLIKEKYRRKLEPSIIVSLGPQKENEIR